MKPLMYAIVSAVVAIVLTLAVTTERSVQAQPAGKPGEQVGRYNVSCGPNYVVVIDSVTGKMWIKRPPAADPEWGNIAEIPDLKK